jgi:FkbM family methyltransferase
MERPRDDTRLSLLELITEDAKSPPFFVQVGAHDGVSFDPVNYLIQTHRWQGIRIEPVPELFQKLKDLHRGNHAIKVENLAVAESRGTRDFYRLKSDSNTPKWETGLGSFLKEVVAKHRPMIPDFDGRLVSEKVPCDRLSNVLAKHEVQKVDVFFIDTEGYDFEIIKQIDFDRHVPKAILFEHKHLGKHTKACDEFLRKRGFALLRLTYDTLAVTRELASKIVDKFQKEAA